MSKYDKLVDAWNSINDVLQEVGGFLNPETKSLLDDLLDQLGSECYAEELVEWRNNFE